MPLATYQIPDLADAGPLTGTELMELVQSGANKKTTVQQIAQHAIFVQTTAPLVSQGEDGDICVVVPP